MAIDGKRGTNWTPLVNMIIAQRINSVLGPLVGPWDVPQLDNETIDIILGITGEFQDMQKGFSEIEKIKDKLRREHRQYGERYKKNRIH